MQGLEYKNIISVLESLFPEFTSDSRLKILADEIPDIYLTFLISYVHSNWNNPSVQTRLAKLMNELAQSKDESSIIAFSDFALDFCLHFEEHNTDINIFLKSLLPATKKDIEHSVEFWKNANRPKTNI